MDKCCAQWNQSFIILIVSGYYNLTCHSSTVFSHSRSFAIRIIQLKMPCSFPFDPFDEGVFSSEIPMAKHFDCYVNGAKNSLHINVRVIFLYVIEMTKHDIKNACSDCSDQE